MWPKLALKAGSLLTQVWSGNHSWNSQNRKSATCSIEMKWIHVQCMHWYPAFILFKLYTSLQCTMWYVLHTEVTKTQDGMVQWAFPWWSTKQNTSLFPLVVSMRCYNPDECHCARKIWWSLAAFGKRSLNAGTSLYTMIRAWNFGGKDRVATEHRGRKWQVLLYTKCQRGIHVSA